jgi:hypothetical protein
MVSQQAGEDGQVEQGMVIEMQDTETGERYRYYVPTGDSQASNHHLSVWQVVASCERACGAPVPCVDVQQC